MCFYIIFIIVYRLIFYIINMFDMYLMFLINLYNLLHVIAFYDTADIANRLIVKDIIYLISRITNDLFFFNIAIFY